MSALRLLLFGLVGLLLGILVGGGVQIGLNVLRFLVQPDWLTPMAGRALTALGGLIAAGALAFGLARAMRHAPGFGSAALLFWALALAALADPYFLAELGWRTPAQHQELLRFLSVMLPAVALAGSAVRAGAAPLAYALLALVAGGVHAGLDRFALVPVLGGDLDLAAMSPLHLMVFARGALLLLLAASASLLYGRNRGR